MAPTLPFDLAFALDLNVNSHVGELYARIHDDVVRAAPVTVSVCDARTLDGISLASGDSAEVLPGRYFLQDPTPQGTYMGHWIIVRPGRALRLGCEGG